MAAPRTTSPGRATPGRATSKGATPERATLERDAPSRPARRVEETSAGGIVLDHRERGARVALIARRNRRGRLVWSLPKGHQEAGETLEQTAVREVREETGIVGIIEQSLGSIDFWFMADGARVHKTVHHFLMRATSLELSDEDPEVDEVAWVPLQDAAGRLRYAGERRVLQTVLGMLAGPPRPHPSGPADST